MSQNTIDDTSGIKILINNMEKLFYSPNIYKICTLKPEDMYKLFYETPYLFYNDNYFYDDTGTQISSNKKMDILFNIIIDFIYIDVKDFDIIFNPTKYFTDEENVNNIKNKLIGEYNHEIENLNKDIIVDRKAYIKTIQSIQTLKKINNNEYDKNPQRMFIKNFLKHLKTIIYNNKVTNKSNKFILKIIFNIFSKINFKKIEFISKNKFENSNIIDKILLEYSNDTILTYLKVRNTDVYYHTKDNYNKSRFDIIGYGIPNNNYSDTLFLKYNNRNKKYSTKTTSELYNSQSLKNSQDSYESVFNKPLQGYTNHYFYGPFNRIFFYDENNEDVSRKMENVLTSLENGKNIFIIGYGASGSGKTSTLIYLKTEDLQEDGIIVYLCKNLSNTYTTFKLKCIEILSENAKVKNNIRKIPNDNSEIIFKIKNGELLLQEEYTYVPEWTTEQTKKFESNTKMGDMILYMIDDDRYIRPTPNNPKSSRSHYMIFIEMSNNDKKTNLIIGDFAGVENSFNCDNNNPLDFYNIPFQTYYNEKFIEYDNNHPIENISHKTNRFAPLIIEGDIFKENENFLIFPMTNFKLNNTGLPYYYIGLNNENCKLKKNNLAFEENCKITIQTVSIMFDKNKYDEKVKTIFFKIFKDKNNKENKDIFTDIMNKINKFIENINSKTAFEFSKIYFLNKSEINNNKILDIINFSDKNLIEYLSLYYGRDNDIQQSYIYHLVNFYNSNKIKLENHWKSIYNDILQEEEKKEKEEEEKKTKEEEEKKTQKNKFEYIKNECDNRNKEGIFINTTLSQLRELITYILIQKNKDKISISPQFIDACFPFYCTKNNCFEISKLSSTHALGSIIYKILNDELKIDVIKNFIMCIFCVLNISPNANNPPPVKYIDINNIKNEYYKKMNYYDKKNFLEFNEFLNNNKPEETFGLIDIKDNSSLKNDSESTFNIYVNEIKKFIEHTDNYNAITSIGTLDFIDRIAKFNLTNITCNHNVDTSNVI